MNICTGIVSTMRHRPCADSEAWSQPQDLMDVHDAKEAVVADNKINQWHTGKLYFQTYQRRLSYKWFSLNVMQRGIGCTSKRQSCTSIPMMTAGVKVMKRAVVICYHGIHLQTYQQEKL